MKKYIFSGIVLSLPLLFVYTETNSINVFNLKGGLFLTFYSLLICTSTLLLYWLKKETVKHNSLIFSFVIAVGVIKLFVGIYRAKPVGFLIILLVAYTLVYFFFIRKEL